VDEIGGPRFGAFHAQFKHDFLAAVTAAEQLAAALGYRTALERATCPGAFSRLEVRGADSIRQGRRVAVTLEDAKPV
jgi:hypothetical protein